MRSIILLLFGASILSGFALANQEESIDATAFDLTKTVSFEEMGHKSAELSSLAISIDDPFIESEAQINLHIIRNPGYGMGNWHIDFYCNNILFYRDMSTSEGDAWTTAKLPTGCLEKGNNEIYLQSRGWEVMLLRDSNIVISEKEKSSEKTLETFGFESNRENASTVEFDSDVGNQPGKLRIHYMTIEPSGGFNYGNWNLAAKLNDVSIGNFNGLSTGDNWLEVEIPSGIINKGSNILSFWANDWPVLILEDSELII